MPEGVIEWFDHEEQHGLIEPDDDGDPIPFSLDAVQDYHSGERISTGQRVVYEIDDMDDEAISVERLSPTGYG
ncbi:cold-shock protein [Longibacter salinarum]|nr:cold shock domain-containing protein [Longibacter salinarum]